MPIPLPPGRDARAALFTSWIVLGSLLIQLVASLTLQADGTLDLVRRVGGVLLALLVAFAFLRLQFLLLLRRSVARWLRWSLILVGVLMLPLSDAWAMLAVSLAALMLTSMVIVTVLVGMVLTGLGVLTLYLHDSGVVATIAIPMVCWLAAAVIAVLTRMATRMEAMRAARENLGRRQIDQERHRISRELHDILGRTLVAVSVRAQTALRLVDRDLEACREQLEQLAATATDGQAQLRRLIRGAVIVGLDSELKNAGDLFGRLGIECELDARPVAAEASQVLAAHVLRESVTNMLKHSRPRRAWISVREEGLATVVTALNDGAPSPSPVDGGTGLSDLAERVRTSGGTLEAGSVAGGRFRVIARIPHADFRSEATW